MIKPTTDYWATHLYLSPRQRPKPDQPTRDLSPRAAQRFKKAREELRSLRHVRVVGARGTGDRRDEWIAPRHQTGGARRNAVRWRAPLLDGIRRPRLGPGICRRRPTEISTTGAAGVAVVTFVSPRAEAAPHQNRTTD